MQEPVKKTTKDQENEGFVYFNPDLEFDESSIEENIEELEDTCARQRRLFFTSYLTLLLINLLNVAYWLLKISSVSENEQNYNNDCQSTGDCYPTQFTLVIKLLLVTYLLWIINLIMGCSIVKYRFSCGTALYFSSFIIIFFSRTTLNIFILLAREKLDILLNGFFNTSGYLVVVLIQTIGDIILCVLNMKIRNLNQKFANFREIKFATNSIVEVKLYNPETERIL